MSGLLATKVRASGGALVQEWCALGACWGCDRLRNWDTRLWSVPEVVIGRGSIGCRHLSTKSGRGP